jgi:drug/metabolite transporter (DMT)-like permease
VTVTAQQAFGTREWALLAAVALMWGSSFLLIDVGVDHLRPELVALLRVAFGAATLAAVPAARRAIPRAAWPPVALLGITWMAVPFVLFPVAQQWIDSSLAGMLNAAAPLFTAVVAAVAARQLPGRRPAIGLLVGFAGVLAITWPSLGDARASAAGIGLVLAATLLYGVAFNLAGPLQQRHGALPVVWRAQLVALALLLPSGLAAVPASRFAWSSLAAMVALGAFGTALAFVAFTTLAGRAGSTRASVSVYFLPPVAIALGAAVRDEPIAAAAVLGTALVLAGAYVVSGRPPQDRAVRPRADRASRPGSRPPLRSAGTAAARRGASPPRGAARTAPRRPE